MTDESFHVARRPEDEQPVESRVTANGVGLCVFEWAGDGPPLLFVHATGFHARCWDEVIRRLPGRRAYAVDMRGHGRSERPDGPYAWARFGDDLTALVRELDLTRIVGVGHSMGGHSVMYAAGREPDRFSGFVLVDPVIGGAARPDAADGEPPSSSFVARRRDRWASPEEMIERFATRPPFSDWEPAVLDDYCRYGLLPLAEGGFELACPPLVEADVYAHAGSTDVADEVARITVPVRVIRAPAQPVAEAGAPRAFTSSPTPPDLATRFAHGEDVPLDHGTHFIPMESPALVARHVDEVVSRLG
ncbi:MAG: alpha/beta hydrolase [Chloroflexi bacterium]|nr:alpha/beta hydrolase [Chloroflexota bacterium]MDA1001753.1 alpha/beta hydrolase [Chloroflexota bacterium]